MGGLRFRILVWVLVFAGLPVLTACTGLKPFPHAARAGDTVALALGSADGMSRANTTAAFISSADPEVSHDLTAGIRGIFRLYGDKASSLYDPASSTRHIVNTSGHEPWLTVMVVDLPPDLPVGAGQVHVNTSAAYPTIGSHINDLPVDLEILPGTGAVADLAYEFGVGSSMPGDLSLMEALPHAQVMPAFPQEGDWPFYGAIEVKLHVPTSAGTAVRVLADDMRVNGSPDLGVLSHRDSNQELTVMLLSQAGRLRYYEPRFSIILVDTTLDGSGTFLATPTITSVRYLDVDGNPLPGPQASTFTVQMR